MAVPAKSEILADSLPVITEFDQRLFGGNTSGDGVNGGVAGGSSMFCTLRREKIK
jgi:hypothetical protein